LAAKRAAPRASLGVLFAATSLADLLWPVFLLLGWEQAHFIPGPNPFLTLWLDSIPISHSLVTLIGWGALFGLAHRGRARVARPGAPRRKPLGTRLRHPSPRHAAVPGRHAAGARSLELRRWHRRRRGSD